MELKGFDVLTANDGVEGFLAVQTFMPDLIFQMLKCQTQTELKWYEKLKKTDGIKDIQEGFEIGVDDYILKPFDMASTMNAINAVL